MYSEAYCMAVKGIDGCMIRVEADISDGLPALFFSRFFVFGVKRSKRKGSDCYEKFRIPVTTEAHYRQSFSGRYPQGWNRL